MVWLTWNVRGWSLVAALLVTAGAASGTAQDLEVVPDDAPLGPVPPCLTPPADLPEPADPPASVEGADVDPAPPTAEASGTCIRLSVGSMADPAATRGPSTAPGDGAPTATPSSGPSDGPSDLASSSYQTVAGTVEKNLHGVHLPDDPTRPQEGEVRGVDANKDALDPLDDPRTDAEGTEERPSPESLQVTPRRTTTVLTLRETVPQQGPPAPMRTPTPASDAPSGPSTTPSSATIGMIDVAWDPQPSQLMVLTGAVISSGLVMYLAGPASSYLRSASGTLRRALRGLFVLPLLVRIKSHQAIEDPKRRVLYNLVDENPGISTKELCEAADMSRSAVEHHLLVVARAGLVVSESIGRGRHYYPAADFLDRRQRRACALLRAGRNREILQVVQRNPGITLTHLVRACGLHASQTHQALESLHGAGLVQRHRAGTSVQYHAVGEPALSA